jgi:hypothetical protein
LRALLVITLSLLSQQVDSDISLLRKKPKGMDEEAWREKRRDAARELGDLGDKRAVDPLIEIVESERFDAILEIAIQSLGKLGDSRAVPALRRIADDPSVEAYVRDSAREAMRRLGAETGGASPNPRGPRSGIEPGVLAAPAQIEGLPRLSAPQVPTGTLALAERVTFAVGELSIEHDSAGGGTLFDVALAGTYQRQMELARLGYSFQANVDTGYDSRSAQEGMMDVSRFLVRAGAGVTGDVRLYLIESLPVFEFVTVAPAIRASYVKQRAATESTSDSTIIDFGVAGGVGYGRVLPVASRLRLARIEAVLEAAGLRARPLAADAAARIALAWYGLRGRLGYSAELAYTLRLLREAGVLLQEPDAQLVYRLLQILADPQLDDRYEGQDLRLGAYWSAEAGDVDAPTVTGVMWSATVARQFGDRADAVGHLRGVARLSEDPKGILTSADAAYRMFFYSSEQDPMGALSVGPFVAVCEDACPGPTAGLVWQVGARAELTHWFSRASSLTSGFEFAGQSPSDFRVLFTLRAGYGLSPASVVF